MQTKAIQLYIINHLFNVPLKFLGVLLDHRFQKPCSIFYILVSPKSSTSKFRSNISAMKNKTTFVNSIQYLVRHLFNLLPIHTYKSVSCQINFTVIYLRNVVHLVDFIVGLSNAFRTFLTQKRKLFDARKSYTYLLNVCSRK